MRFRMFIRKKDANDSLTKQGGGMNCGLKRNWGLNFGWLFSLEIETVFLWLPLPNKGYNSTLNQWWYVAVKFAKMRNTLVYQRHGGAEEDE